MLWVKAISHYKLQGKMLHCRGYSLCSQFVPVLHFLTATP